MATSALDSCCVVPRPGGHPNPIHSFAKMATPALCAFVVLDNTVSATSAFQPALFAQAMNCSLVALEVLTACASTMCAEVVNRKGFEAAGSRSVDRNDVYRTNLCGRNWISKSNRRIHMWSQMWTHM